jgi:glycosyltransferase involved in cell wall biosynthesis
LHVIHDEMAEVALRLVETWGLPYVQTVDDFAVLDRGLRLSRRWFRRLVATSEELADELARSLGIPTERISIISPGITLHPSPPRSSGWKVPVIGAAGPPVTGSGFANFVEAARLVLDSGRDAEFLIASQGDDGIDLRRLAQFRKISERLSVVDYTMIGARFWTVLDIYCQPSQIPSMGRALALAMAQGIPSIATNVKGLQRLIDHGHSGLIVPSDDPQALASAITQILDHTDRATLMGLAAQAATRGRFDPDVEADSLAALYRSLLDFSPQADTPHT